MANDPGRRPRIVVLAGHYLPGHKAGGPIRSIRNLVAALGREFDFRIVTTDRDFGDSAPYDTVAIDRWTDVGEAAVYYTPPRRRLRTLARLLNSVDPRVVYLNSFFSQQFSIQPLVGRRLGLVAPRAGWIVAPRGELSEGALALKPTRKRAFLLGAASIGIHRGVTWQATSAAEAADIRSRCRAPDRAIRTVPNLTETVGVFERPPALDLPATPLRVCFLSRVSPKKNLRYAIDVLRNADRPIEFHVYGPEEDEAYTASCRAAAAAAGPSLRTFWHGGVPHEEVRGILARHHLFFLPTLGENFGHAIFEALAAGVPVLLSDRTPWCDVEAAGAGWALPLAEPGAFVEVVRRVAGATTDERSAAARGTHADATDHWLRSDAVAASREMLLAAAAEGGR